MTGGDSHRGEWTLSKATAADIDALMNWFPGEDDVVVWGGPAFRFPYSRETFLADIHWGKMASFCLFDTAGEFVGFGQVFKLRGRVHLARLVVHPDARGEGIGKRLVKALMEAGSMLYSGKEYSLFVLRDNTPAYECYRSLGFEVDDYPDDMPYADICYFLTRPTLEN